MIVWPPQVGAARLFSYYLFKFLEVDTLDVHIGPADLPHSILLKVEAVKCPFHVLDVQGVVETFDSGHITGVGEQHRVVPVHGVVFCHKTRAGR